MYYYVAEWCVKLIELVIIFWQEIDLETRVVIFYLKIDVF